MLYLIAEKKNGQIFEASPTTDIPLLKFNDQSPTIEAYNEAIEGLNRSIFSGNRVSRTVSIELLIQNQYFRDGLRKINRFFVDGEKIYLRHSQSLGFRFPVQVQDIKHERYTDDFAKVTIEFLCETPTKESVEEIEFKFPSKLRTLDGSWYLDGTYLLDAGFKVPFPFDLDSDVLLDPRIYPFEIEFKGNSKNLIIANETTGDEFKYYGKTSDDDLLLITNTKVTLNGKSVVRSTNKSLLTFAPGENTVKVRNFSGFFTFKIRYRKQYY